MLFSTVPFLYYFLPGVFLFYFLAPKKLKNTVLLLASLFFYGWGEPKYIIIMVLSITQGYLFGILVEKYQGSKWSKVFLTTSVVISLALLGYCKYVDFFISSFNAISGLALPLTQLALPIGISFYTFQILSYVVDVYRKEVKAQYNFVSLAAYVAMFPQLIAGPIVRYSDIAQQLNERTHKMSDAALGTRRFIVGLSKKMLIANVLGELVSLFKASDEKSVLFFWLYAIAYTLHIYFDFSGYSDMAIGLGKIFGFHFPENFNYPYISKSITEFWRRWHISLGSWFRDYVYIPMGGNRVSKYRHLFNILVVWMLTGLWHGAAWNFVAWGLLYAILLMGEKLCHYPKSKTRNNEKNDGAKYNLEKDNGVKGDKIRHNMISIVQHSYVMLFVILGFVLFDAASMKDAISYMKSMFGLSGYPLYNTVTGYYFRSYFIVFVIGIVGATPWVSSFVAKIRKNTRGEKILNLLEPIWLLVLLALCTAYMVDGAFNPFLYFRF
ncbi:MAG: MBOAT family O-acyltransferase [Lachnospiraceae bacterium]